MKFINSVIKISFTTAAACAIALLCHGAQVEITVNAPNAGTSDSIRTTQIKANTNFTYLFNIATNMGGLTNTAVTATGTVNVLPLFNSTRTLTTSLVSQASGVVRIGPATENLSAGTYSQTIRQNVTNASGYALGLETMLYGTGSATELIIGAQSDPSGSSNVDLLQGINFKAEHFGSGVLAEARGVKGAILTTNGPILLGPVFRARVRASTPGTVGTGYGYLVESAEGGSLLTNIAGVHVADQLGPKNFYGLFVTNQTTTSGVKYPIYTMDGSNYFGGSVGIGITNPSAPLHVIGNATISGELTRNGTNLQTTLSSLQTQISSGSGAVTGSGTTNTLAIWNGSGTVGASAVTRAGSLYTFPGSIVSGNRIGPADSKAILWPSGPQLINGTGSETNSNLISIFGGAGVNLPANILLWNTGADVDYQRLNITNRSSDVGIYTENGGSGASRSLHLGLNLTNSLEIDTSGKVNALSTISAPALVATNTITLAGTNLQTTLDGLQTVINTKLLMLTNVNSPAGVSITGGGGLGSSNVTAAVYLNAATGWTNTMGVLAQVTVDGTLFTAVWYNNAGTATYTNSTTLGHDHRLVQDKGKVIITGGTGITIASEPL